MKKLSGPDINFIVVIGSAIILILLAKFFPGAFRSFAAETRPKYPLTFKDNLIIGIPAMVLWAIEIIKWVRKLI